jgi:hypothetical protein
LRCTIIFAASLYQNSSSHGYVAYKHGEIRAEYRCLAGLQDARLPWPCHFAAHNFQALAAGGAIAARHNCDALATNAGKILLLHRKAVGFVAQHPATG